ncbi:AAA family ATPase [Limibacter armeniacum]|uniref:AAA family ATPase n=1 Tax=Limibacter armeniacum TaxID=466084 RepID=UPI002FE695BC
MRKILVLRGLPASGKTTFAKALLEKEPNVWKRVNRDEMREMLDSSVHSPDNERFVLTLRDWLIRSSIKAGRNVIVDDTNLAPIHLKKIRAIAQMLEVETGEEVTVSIEEFDTQLEECIQRDAQRQNSVGEEVIRQMYEEYYENQEE